MHHHKLPVLSKTPNFWLQLKSLFHIGHIQADHYGIGLVNHLTSPQYTNRPIREAAYEWQIKTKAKEDAIAIARNAQKWRNDWSHFITSDIDSYSYTPNEGLKDITVNLSNKTSVKIDYIQVKVLYFEEDGKLYKSEYAELFDITPLSTQTIPVYSSPVGSTLKVHITNVVATAFNLAFSQDSYE